jgi:ADP-ribose pyrophosphatase YjhB (NUDIX family)
VRVPSALPETHIAADGEVLPHHDGKQNQDWLVSWHPAHEPPPEGKRHGAEGLCVLPDGRIIEVSEDGGVSWGLPGGRPEGDEDWRATLDREVHEEACAVVEEATLLGYGRSECIRGHEQGLVLVRSLWRASVRLLDWDPQHEMTDRRLVTPAASLERIKDADVLPIYRRMLREAFGDEPRNA